MKDNYFREKCLNFIIPLVFGFHFLYYYYYYYLILSKLFSIIFDQEGIESPPLSVTGLGGADGHTKRTWGSLRPQYLQASIQPSPLNIWNIGKKYTNTYEPVTQTVQKYNSRSAI